MNEREKRLQQLLDLAFKTQVEAAEGLGVSQSTINRWLNEGLPDNFMKKYGDRLKAQGLNPNYIDNATEPMRYDADPIAAISDKIEALRQGIGEVQDRIEVLRTAAQ